MAGPKPPWALGISCLVAIGVLSVVAARQGVPQLLAGSNSVFEPAAGFRLIRVADAGDAHVSLGEQGAPVPVAIGRRLVVQLPAQPGTGFRWTITSKPDCIEAEADAAGGADPQVRDLGAPRPQTFTFRARTVGEGALRLEYRRPWVRDGEPARVFQVQVLCREG